MKEIGDVPHNVLLCMVLRHRWVPLEGDAGVVDGARVIKWQLYCETGCNCHASEWRDLKGARVPGTARQYNYTDEYREALDLGLSQNELWAELGRRDAGSRVNRAG